MAINATQRMTSVIFIDGALPDLQAILSGLDPSVTAIVLDPAQDGIQQMADALAGMSGLDAIHIISHGSSGQINLGTAQLSQDTLAQYQTQLATIGHALSSTGDLLLYGCNVAQGEVGQAFILALASATGADVAASTDLTGAAFLGGNWQLEVATGGIETNALNADIAGVLADTVPGGLSTTLNLPVPGSITGMIDAADMAGGADADADWYWVYLNAGTNYQFALTSSTLDGVLQVYDSTGVPLAYADNGVTGDPETLNFNATFSDFYYVSASDYWGDIGDYALSATVTATGGAVDTVGDWYADANVGTLAAAGSVSGSINNGYDSDWYAVQLTGGQNYLFGLSSVAPLDTSLSLYDANGWYLDSSWTYQGDESLFFSAASTGTYYLAVYGDYANTGSFTLTSSTATAGGGGTDTIPDGITTSATLAAGGSISGAIDSSTDYGDWYGVSLLGNATYQFNLSATLLDGQLGLYDANGGELSWVDSGLAGGDPETLVYTATQAGVYYIGVSGYYGSAGDFQLGLSQLSAGGSTVDNVGGSSGAASLINVPGQINGTIDDGTDADWYAVNLSANTLYQFDLSSFFIDGILAVYDANSVQQAYMDNGWYAGDPESLYYTPTAAGTYYVAVSGYGGTTGSFQLDAIGYASQTGDFVADGTSTTAAVSMPGTVWGVIDSADSTGGDDADWYSVRLNAGSTYRVDLSGDSNLDGVLAMYDTDGMSWLAGADAGYQGDSEYFYYSPTATGDYYVAVDGWSNTTGEFWLSVAQTSGGSSATDTVGQTAGTSASVAVSSTAPGHVDGAIDDSADADWYAVTLTANTQYEFNLGSYSLDGVLQLYDSSGTQLEYVDNAWTAGSENLVYTTPATDGTYYIGVSGYGSSTGDFLLDIYSSGTVSNVDTVGDTYQTAASGLLNTGGTAVRGQVDSGVDEDVYSVALTANTTYLFDLSSTSLDGTLILYGTAGEWLDSADYGGTGGAENLYFTPLISGNYYIGAGGWSSSTGSYDLSASALAITGDEVPGNTTSTENLWVPGFVDNQIGTATDMDWFSIRMNQGSEYSFNLYSNDGALDGVLQVFDANGSPVYDLYGNGYADNGWYAGDAENLYFTAPATGDYFIQVSGYGGTTGSYSLYAAEAWDATAVDWTVTTSYDEVKWGVVDWWSWDTTAWSTYSDPIAWSDVGWSEIVDYSALEWSYVDWTEFNSTTYNTVEYEQIDWNELLVADWTAIDWNYIYADSISWDQLQYESVYDPVANYDPLTGWNIDSTTADAAGNIGNDSVVGGVANDTVSLGMGLDYFSGDAGADIANGGEGADYLEGGAGNDTLNGGFGNDEMVGGSGADTYTVDAAGDIVFEADNTLTGTSGFRLALDLGSNIDKVISSISYTLGNYLENLELTTGTGNLTGTGNTLDNILTGNEGNNILTGAGGNDVFAFAANGNGLDTITDFSAGDSITVTGAAFSGTIATGDGSTVQANQIQLASANGVTTLYIGTDSTAGADVQIQLTGTFSANAFSLNTNRVVINSAPTGSVTITGTATQGQTLTAANTLADADGLGTISYQWQANGTNITGATNSTYLLTQAEVGKAISVVASYTDGHGTLETVASASASASVIATTSKYYITASPGSNLLDFELSYGALSLDGQAYVYSGSSSVDAVFVRPGIVFDFTGSGASADKLYLAGNYADYTPSIAGTIMTLSRTVGQQTETIKVSKLTSLLNSDKLVFADGTVSTFDLYAHLNSGAAAPTLAGETSVVPSFPATLNATVKAYAVDSLGETFAPVNPGMNLMAIGSSGVDIVYIRAGSNVDASSLGGNFDKIYLTGNWSDYTKTVAGTTIIFESTGTDAEYVKVAAAASSSNDYLVFADGYVRSNDAKTALQSDVNAAITAVTGYSTAEVTPLGTGDILTGTAGVDTLNGTAAGNDTIVISDTGTIASSSATIQLTSTAHGTDTIIGFSAAPVASGGDVLNFSAIANLTDAVATGQTLNTDFAASNVFIFDATPVTIADAANAIANGVSVLATDGYIVIADSANGNAVTAYNSTDLAGNGIETALVVLSGVNIDNLLAANFLV